MEQVVLERNKKHHTHNLIFYTVVLLVSLSGLINNILAGSFVMKLLTIIGLIIYFLIARASLKEILSKSPALILNENGFEDNISLSKIGKISWEEVSDIETEKSGKVKQLLVHLKNPQAYFEGKTPFEKGVMERLMKKHGTFILIYEKKVAIKEESLYETFYEFYMNNQAQIE